MKKLTLVFFLMVSFALNAQAQKLTAEEIIQKHLDAVGSKDDRAKITNQAYLGTFKFTLPLQKDLIYVGTTALAGESTKRLFNLNFNKENNSDFVAERFLFNDKDVKIAKARFNQYSALGDFLLRNEIIMKENLLGGAMFNTWAINNLENTKAKVKADGKKKINGNEAYILEYSPKKGSGLSIKLFFDVTTFHHVRTEYKRELGAQIGSSPETSARQSETKETLTEDFSDYKMEQIFNLPHQYKITYAITGSSSKEFRYEFLLTKVYFNENIGDDPFELKTK